MGDILFLAHRIPYPPDKGDKIRSWNMLRFLASRGRVHLGAFVDDPEDMRHAEALKAICGDVKLIELKKSERWRRGLRGLMKGEALSLSLYYDPAMVVFVREVLRSRNVDRLFVFSSQMAPYALPYVNATRNCVMDFVDVDSEKWQQYAAESKGWRQRIYYREAKLLRAMEKIAARNFDSSLFASEAEAVLFRKLAGSWGHTVHGISNGVDSDFFSPAGVQPFAFGSRPAIVFTGAMDYRPNIEAVDWFVTKVMPRLRRAAPGASFTIVGSSPTPEVMKLGEAKGVTVTGRVPDVRPYLAGADAVVAPLQIGRGIQNKVLEAMAMARPVVATAAAFEGIEAVPGQHLLIADSPDDMVTAIQNIIAQPAAAAAMGAAARQHVVATYSWAARLAPLDALLKPKQG